MESTGVVSILREMAFFSELKNENPFKIRALQRSAELLEEQGKDLPELVRSGGITKIPGVGKGTQALVKEFVDSGKVAEHESLRREFPEGILELLEIRGLGPKKIKALYEQLTIGSVGELKYACQENRLLELKGFGQKTQDSVLKNIEALKANRSKAILPMAMNQAEEMRAELLALAGVSRVEETGELRRKFPVIASLDFVVAGDSELPVVLVKAGFAEAVGVFERKLPDTLKVRVWAAGAENFGARLFSTTGPEKFVAGKNVAAAAEEELVFHALGLAVVPPESRDLGAAPAGLVKESDIKGVFHLHTTWSDGKNTLAEMAAGAVERGYEYLGVSEHSQTAFYANGLNAKRIAEQRREIEGLREKFPSLRIFHGIESDILPDGSLDFPEDVLAGFDFVIASIHGQMRMSSEEMTKRICRALENPATTWLGHWSGRLLLAREPFAFDQEKVLATAAKLGKGIELNSNPYRLDLDWQVAGSAAALGIPIGIFPDAHSVGGFDDLKYGVWMARKAGLTAAQVSNTKSRKEMEEWLGQQKSR
jgi:DNA polymerase (family 10)